MRSAASPHKSAPETLIVRVDLELNEVDAVLWNAQGNLTLFGILSLGVCNKYRKHACRARDGWPEQVWTNARKLPASEMPRNQQLRNSRAATSTWRVLFGHLVRTTLRPPGMHPFGVLVVSGLDKMRAPCEFTALCFDSAATQPPRTQPS